MRDKNLVRILKTATIVCIIVTISLSLFMITKFLPFSEPKSIPKFVENQMKSAQISTKPNYIVYPTIPNITITDEDNISLYASSGDGLSWETAYIIENLSINGNILRPIYINNISSFIKIRNFQVFPNRDCTMIDIEYCKNIGIENGSLISDIGYYTEAFAIRHSSVQIFDVYIQDSSSNRVSYSYNCTFEQVIYDGLRFSKMFYLDWCNNISFVNNYFSHNSYSYATLEGFRCHGNYNITFQRNSFNNNGLRILSDSSLVDIENNSFTQVQNIVFQGTDLLFRNNSVNFKGYRFTIYGSDITIENNYFSSSYNSMQGNDGVLYLNNCTNAFIRYNTFDSDQAILGILECRLVFFEHNTIQVRGEFVINTHGSLNFIQTDFSFRWNDISGTYSYLFSDIGGFKVFIMLFTNKLPLDPLILSAIIILCIFLIIGTIYISNLPVILQEFKNSSRKRNLFHVLHPFTLGALSVLLTNRILDRYSFFMLLLREELQDMTQIYYIQLGLCSVLWIGALTYIGIKFGLFCKKLKLKRTKSGAENMKFKKMVIKQLSLILIPSIILLIPMLNFHHLFSHLTLLLHFGIMNFVLSLGFQKEFKNIGISLIRVSSITAFMLIDIVVSFILAFFILLDLSLQFYILGYVLLFFLKLAYFGKYLEMTKQNPLHYMTASESQE